MKIVESEFKFKGTRDYVHGTDIYNYTMKNLLLIDSNHKNFTKFTLSFLRQTMKNIKFYIGDKNEFQNFEQKESITFRGSVELKNETLFFWGTERDSQIDGRYEYNEKMIEDNSFLKDKTISFNSLKSDLSIIENIIPMNKKLLGVCCPDFKGKWMFTRLDLTHLTTLFSTENLELELYQATNPKLVCSNISIGGIKAGRIFFSLT